MVTRRLQVERRTGKVRQSKTNVLPLPRNVTAAGNDGVAPLPRGFALVIIIISSLSRWTRRLYY